MNKKKVIVVILVLLFALVGIIFYHKSQKKYNGETEIRVISPHNTMNYSAFECNGELYIEADEGIVKYSENGGTVPVVSFDIYNSDFTVHDEKIYLVDNGSGGAFLSVYDMNGAQISEKQKLPVEKLNYIGVSENYLIGCVNSDEDEKIFKAFDMNNDLVETAIPFKQYATNSTSYCGYETDYICAEYLSRRSVMVRNGDYINHSNSYCIAANDKYFVFDINIMPPTIEYFSLSTRGLEIINGLSKYDAFSENSSVTLAELNGDTLMLTLRENRSERIDLRVLNDSDKLKEHLNDLYVVFDLASGKVQRKHTFKQYERIIYADSEKIMTYKDGRCITYSADDFSELSEQAIDFIVEDKSYCFYVETDNIFVLDNARENLLGKISVK